MISRGDSLAGAVFSDCELYRYRLWRVWDESKPKMCYVMLNPSTATHEVLDPTVSRCKKRAEMMGYGGLEVVNIFALRSTDPRALYAFKGNPIGERNGVAISRATRESDIVICAWGTHGKFLEMGKTVRDLLQFSRPKKTYYLKLNSDGSPAHPLYLGYDLKPVLWEE